MMMKAALEWRELLAVATCTRFSKRREVWPTTRDPSAKAGSEANAPYKLAV